MNIAKFNPFTEAVAFCPILHPLDNSPIVDEDGVTLGFDVVPPNSRTANSLRKQMLSNIAQFKADLSLEMGRPVKGDKPDDISFSEHDTAFQDQLREWEESNQAEFEAKCSEFAEAQALVYLSGCCTAVRGRLELDCGKPASVLQIFEDQSWIANRVHSFHSNLENWLPKPQGS